MMIKFLILKSYYDKTINFKIYKQLIKIYFQI